VDYKEILEQINSSDYNAGVEALFAAYADSFYGYAVNRWGFSEDEAWDAVYQTLDKLADRLPDLDFSSQNQFDSYVFTVFKSFLSKGYRRKSRLKQKMRFVSLEDTPEGTIKHENLLISGFDESFMDEFIEDKNAENPKLKILNEALNELNDFDKQLLLLRAQNYSYDEIAVLIDTENRQLKVAHFRAKERLIKQLNKSKILQDNEPKI